jgi:hypothetical protein
MFRIFVAVVAVTLIAAPSILIALRWNAAPPVRLLVGGLAFVTPLVLIWAIHLVPAFNGQAPQDAAFWRGVGILLSTSTLIFPWLVYSALRDRLAQD